MARLALPYDMFDVTRSAEEARRFSRMESIYHRGQDHIWDGNEVLDELWEKHGGAKISPAKVPAAQRVLGTIMWGELAAWKIASQFANELEPLEARMAATSQAHDEARHFYVLHDYLVRATGDFPRRLHKGGERLLAATLHGDTIAKRLIGMQLQLEPTALTLFHALRDSDLCPVLSDLLVYYERDEARHVGLGLQLLPGLMQKMGVRESLEFTAFSLKIGAISIGSLKSIEADLRGVGINPRAVAILGKSKQLKVFEQLWRTIPGGRNETTEKVANVLDAAVETLWPAPETRGSAPARVRRILKVLKNGIETIDTVLDPSGDLDRDCSAPDSSRSNGKPVPEAAGSSEAAE